MRVALDATPLTLAGGGLRRYTLELSRALAAEFPADEFVLTSDQLPGAPRGFLDRRWWSWGLNRALTRAGVDVFHGTNFEVPYWPARPSVLTLHDLSPWIEAVRPANSGRVRRRTPLLIRLGIATMIVVPSDAVRLEAIARFGIRPDRIAAVHEAAAAVFRPVETRPAAPYANATRSASNSRPAPRATNGSRSFTPARWHCSIRPSTKASGCRLSRPCSAALR
jgi:hypothetical protein